MRRQGFTRLTLTWALVVGVLLIAALLSASRVGSSEDNATQNGPADGIFATPTPALHSYAFLSEEEALAAVRATAMGAVVLDAALAADSGRLLELTQRQSIECYGGSRMAALCPDAADGEIVEVPLVLMSAALPSSLTVPETMANEMVHAALDGNSSELALVAREGTTFMLGFALDEERLLPGYASPITSRWLVVTGDFEADLPIQTLGVDLTTPFGEWRFIQDNAAVRDPSHSSFDELLYVSEDLQEIEQDIAIDTIEEARATR